ncbi:glycosyltransferase family 4 protein [Gleimia hominis]|uniref:Glycosyltransferase family 4 protein n=1 Tax=Gleimia hominis TaxID=595468 RepID=A0ABU3IA13_9ACTO|nr:glycosyltransferase family 4 protein [Gleimia hominis]MDT3767214.1 glycosyltransferase family 4 protein [Gleimia hominis]
MIAYVASRIFMPEPAAASFRLKALADALSEKCVTRVLTTRTESEAEEQAFDASVPFAVKRFPVLRDKTGYVRGYLQYMSFDIPLFFRLLGVPSDAVVVNEPPPTTGVVTAAAALLKRFRHVYYAADIWSDASESTGVPPIVVRAVRAMESFAMRRADAVIAVSDGVAQRCRELGAKRVVVVPNGVDTQVLTPEGPRGPVEGEYFIYAGTTSEWQGADVFIRAVRKVWETAPQTKVVFVGQGADWQHLQAVADGDERIIFHDLMPPQEVAKYYRGAVGNLASIKPGLGYDFAYPTKILAGLACGTPVVYAGPGPAVDDIGQYDLGVACAHDVEAVADAMLQVMNDQLDRSRLHRWVVEHRSTKKTGLDAAKVVLEAMNG